MPERDAPVERARIPAPYGIPLLAAGIIAFLLGTGLGRHFCNTRGHDFRFHLSSWLEVTESWREGTLFPRWAQWAYRGLGEPRFVFYPPASWTLGAALGAILPWTLVPGAFAALVFVLAGLSMFRLARESLPDREARWAGFVYAFNPYNLVMVYARSSYSELLASALIPLVFLGALKLARAGAEGIAPLAVAFAGCWLVNAPTAVVVSYAIALVLVIEAGRRRTGQVLLWGAAAVALAVALAAFYVLPAAREMPWVSIQQAVTPRMSPEANFLFSGSKEGRFNGELSIVALGEMAIVGGAFLVSWHDRRDRPESWVVFVSIAVVSGLLMFRVSRLGWAALPGLHFVQFPWRWLSVFSVPYAYLVASVRGRPATRAAWRAIPLMASLVVGFVSARHATYDVEDVAELQQALRTRVGYFRFGREYLPTGCSPDRLPKDLPDAALIPPDPGASVVVERWAPQRRVVRVAGGGAGPAVLVLRLFSYPAWTACVDGRIVATKIWGEHGQVAVPVPAGGGLIEVDFGRTLDRTVGAGVSIAALLVLGSLWFRRGKKRSVAPENATGAASG